MLFVVFTHIFTWILIFKGLTAQRLYKSFGVKGLILSVLTTLLHISLFIPHPQGDSHLTFTQEALRTGIGPTGNTIPDNTVYTTTNHITF
jgi:hypothetical protein